MRKMFWQEREGPSCGAKCNGQNNNTNNKELEKIEKYQNFKIELKRLWSLKKVEIVPVVVGALGCIRKGFSRWVDMLGIKQSAGMIQK